MRKSTSIVMITLMSMYLLSVSAYKNPVQGARDSPDPGVVYDGHNYYAATT